MVKIHFSSGKVQEISTGKLDKFIMDLKGRGMKLAIDRNETRTLIIPLNSNTMEFIEQTHEAVIKPEPKVEAKRLTQDGILDYMQKELQDSKKEMEDKKDVEEKEEDAMKLMFEKSNCTHPEKYRVYYKQETSKGSRYFPVCSFCGKRERYVKADSLDDDVKANAPVWED